jgi:hypothetical protein
LFGHWEVDHGAIRAVPHAYTYEKSLVLVPSLRERPSAEPLAKARPMLTKLGTAACRAGIIVKARVSDDMYKTLRPMLALRNGDLWLMSTPNGKRGFFYEEEWSTEAPSGIG